MEILAFLFIIGLVSSQITYSNAQGAGGISVLDNGAVGDGKTDSTQGFMKAWTAACSATTESSKIIVPAKNTFLLKQITFKGPCKPKNITFEIAGTILAPNSPTAWNGIDAAFWVAFESVTGLTVDGLGSGTFDGQGKGWWDQSCRYHPNLKGCTKLAPTSLRFQSSKQVTLKGIKIIQSPQTHVLFYGCDGVTATNVECNSPKDSPNTDGIHIQACHGMTISNCKIANGDDNISIGDYTSDLDISNIECGPGGHGISIGSLGKDGGQVEVKNIHVKNVSFTETTNGARIKTWQVGKGIVKNITYEEMKFTNCESPIVIDQNYCAVRGQCKEEATGVAISDVIFRGFSGTASLVETVQIACSKAVPCAGITLDNINLSAPGKVAKAICSNAKGTEVGTVKPGPCLTK